MVGVKLKHPEGVKCSLDMIELYDPDIDALGYVSTEKMSEAVRVKRSEATKL